MGEETAIERTERVVRPFLGLLDQGDSVSSLSSLWELGLDSMTSIELVLALEEEFGIEIPDADLKRDLFASLSCLTAAMARLAAAASLP